MFMKNLGLLLLVAIFPFVQLYAQQPDLDALDQYFEKMAKDWEIPSATIGIVKDGALVFTGSYGVLEVGKKEKPNEHTLYATASNSKAFTSALIGMLVQEGKLGWNDKVKDYLPYFEVYDRWVSDEVTVRDLLCHRVGLGTFSGDVIWYKSDFTAEQIIKRIQYLPKAYDFRAGYGYSNLMYVTAGELIKTVTGKSWGENVQERILEPLGMDRTITTIKRLEAKGNFATPHARVEDKNVPIDWEDWEAVGATGGIISSISDMAKWMIFNLNHGIHGKDTLLSAATRNLIWTPHNSFTVNQVNRNSFNTHFSGYGLGWGLRDYHGKMMVRHTGGYDGMITAVTLIPDENLGVVVLTNGMKSPITAATYYALDRFMGKEEKDWSATMLSSRNSSQLEDKRISSRKEKRVNGTKPSLKLTGYTGTYHSKIHGPIYVTQEGGELKLSFKHAPALNATLRHWHHDVWEIDWDQRHAWFSFGTLQFNLDNNLKVTGMAFDVPNDDIFFEELKPYRVKP